jgi:hypothetical protein
MNMIALDYFLYDNRTWASRIGRDWGVKAATGVLASRSDLQSSFERYCGALPSDHGYLSGFGQALGGIRPASGAGYLLCAALETSDSFGRPSWAVYGLWCPDAATLEKALAGDPIRAAQAALGAETPPNTIELRSFGLSLPAPRCLPTETRFRQFDRKSTGSEVTSLLLGAIRRGAPLPNVLGVTAGSRLPAFARQFNVVYCHPLDDRSDRAFAQHRSDEPFATLDQIGDVPPIPGSSRRVALLWTTICVAAVAAVVAFLRPHWMVFYPARADSPAEITLREIQTQLTEIRDLDPEELRKAAQESDRQTVLDAYAALIEDRERIVGHAHEFQTYDTGAKLQNIQLLLNDRPPGKDACKVIGTENPTVRRWCEALAKLERTAQALRVRTIDSQRKSS